MSNKNQLGLLHQRKVSIFRCLYDDIYAYLVISLSSLEKLFSELLEGHPKALLQIRKA